MSQVAKFDTTGQEFDESIFDIEGDYMASINILMNNDKSVTAH